MTFLTMTCFLLISLLNFIGNDELRQLCEYGIVDYFIYIHVTGNAGSTYVLKLAFGADHFLGYYTFPENIYIIRRIKSANHLKPNINYIESFI